MSDWAGEVYVFEPGRSNFYRGVVECRGDTQSDLVGRRPVENDTASQMFSERPWDSSQYPPTSEPFPVGSVPQKLFDLTLTYVAARLHLIDSLQGFPEQVGRQLFDEAVRLDSFRRPLDCSEPFRLFAGAYGRRFVETCELRGLTMDAAVVDAVEACSSALTAVSWFDLEFPSSNLRGSIVRCLSQTRNLVRLTLVNCGLCDDDLRLLTAPARMNVDQSLSNLQELDLSGNYDLSGCCVRYLSAFPRLRLLKMTGTTVTSNRGLEKLEEINLRLASTDHVARLLELERGAFDAGSRHRSDDAPWADSLFKSWPKRKPEDDTKKSKHDFAFASFYNVKRERLKEARRRNVLTVPMVFVKRGEVGKENWRPRSAPTSSRGGEVKRKKRSLLEAASALEAIWGNEDEASVDVVDSRSEDKEDWELTRLYGGSESSRNSKRQKRSFFDSLT